MKLPCVYIMASRPNGTLYTGVTSDLIKRVFEHKQMPGKGFTGRYGCPTLVWFEPHETMENAISREKALKGSSRKRKIGLIEDGNPNWVDLYDQISSG